MKKMSKNIMFIIIGALLAFTIDVAAEAVISSGSVSYGNTTVSSALDELFSAVDINEKIVEIEEEISLLKNTAASINEIYPVGSIYISVNSANPNTLFSGTEWEQFSQGRTLIGVGTTEDSRGVSKTFEANKFGGEYEHQLTINEMPPHNHQLNIYGQNIYYFSDAAGTNVTTPFYPNGQSVAFLLNSAYSGGGAAHNNIQPYATVYIWKRIA